MSFGERPHESCAANDYPTSTSEKEFERNWRTAEVVRLR